MQGCRAAGRSPKSTACPSGAASAGWIPTGHPGPDLPGPHSGVEWFGSDAGLLQNELVGRVGLPAGGKDGVLVAL